MVGSMNPNDGGEDEAGALPGETGEWPASASGPSATFSSYTVSTRSPRPPRWRAGRRRAGSPAVIADGPDVDETDLEWVGAECRGGGERERDTGRDYEAFPHSASPVRSVVRGTGSAGARTASEVPAVAGCGRRHRVPASREGGEKYAHRAAGGCATAAVHVRLHLDRTCRAWTDSVAGPFPRPSAWRRTPALRPPNPEVDRPRPVRSAHIPAHLPGSSFDSNGAGIPPSPPAFPLRPPAVKSPRHTSIRAAVRAWPFGRCGTVDEGLHSAPSSRQGRIRANGQDSTGESGGQEASLLTTRGGRQPQPSRRAVSSSGSASSIQSRSAARSGFG